MRPLDSQSMGAWVTRKEAATGAEPADRAASEGSAPRVWGNPPGDTYTAHSHSYHKVLYCVRGSIVFHVDGEDLELHPGDRLDVEPGTEHAATVGRRGVECVETAR